MTLDLLGDGGSSDVILGSGPTWLPDGTLLFTTHLLRPHREVARRIRDHGLGRTLDLVIDEREATPAFPGSYTVHGDASGLQGFRGSWDDPRPVVLRWSGDVVKRSWSDAPLLVLGAERSAGAGGERVTDCRPWDCPVVWRQADGSVRDLRVPAGIRAWTRDGAALVALDYDRSRAHLIRASADDLEVQPLAELPQPSLEGDSFDFAAMSSWSSALETDEADGRVTIIPFDGTAALGPFEGSVAAVNE